MLHFWDSCSFYGRLFPRKSVHFMHTSTSLHFLSQSARYNDRSLNDHREKITDQRDERRFRFEERVFWRNWKRKQQYERSARVVQLGSPWITSCCRDVQWIQLYELEQRYKDGIRRQIQDRIYRREFATGGSAAGGLPRWKRCDYMVRCWILNSMTTEISEGFMYADSALQLWEELVERYAQTNGPLLYQLKKSLCNLTQGFMTVAEYFVKLKKFWDEILSIEGIPKCTCGAHSRCSCEVAKKVAEIENRNKMLQFLMGLNDTYDSVRNQILAMDSLPSVNKAYYIVQQVEVAGGDTSGQSSQDSSAFAVNKSSSMKKSFKKDKADKLCSHCGIKGHTIEGCFKIIGYPEWFKDPKGKKAMKTTAAVTKVYESPLDDGEMTGEDTWMDLALVNAVCQEVIKVMKGKGQVRFASTNSAGP